MPEGRQSPPPENQTGAQLQDPPASGKGTDDATNKEETNKQVLEVSNLSYPRHHPSLASLLTTCQNLSSNPKGPLDDAVKEKFAKTQ